MTTPQIYTFSSLDVVSKTAENIADLLIEKTAEKKAITVFLSGGSAIAMNKVLLEKLQKVKFSRLTLTLIDERFGKYGHDQSNEQQLRSTGVLDLATKIGGKFIGMLSSQNLPFAQTLAQINQNYAELFKEESYKLALLGLGEDGHTAGWLPTNNEAKFVKLYESKNPVVFYEVNESDSNNPHKQRLTISTSTVPKMDQIIIYTKGSSKKAALEHFIKRDTPINQTPALALYQNPNPIIVLTDQT